MILNVVSYSISTSNHNHPIFGYLCIVVVSYSISTSNHNLQGQLNSSTSVVSYSISTSNHNPPVSVFWLNALYLIPFLHQTTTMRPLMRLPIGCILFHFYIKPQPFVERIFGKERCILFHFYIKPQLHNMAMCLLYSCILFHFYIKPQPMAHKTLFSSTLSPKSHSHFQRNAVV